MATEQSAPDSEPSITDRLFTALTPEAEQPEEQVTEAEPSAEEVPSFELKPEAEEVQAEPDTVDFEDDDGTVYKIPAALKEKIPLRADYTRKTQQAATLAEAAHDRLQFAEAREQFMSSVMQEVAEVKSLQARLKEYDGLDLSSLYSTDPGAAMRIRDQRDDLRRQIQEREAAIGGKASQLEKMAEAHASKQWELAVDGVKKRLGNISKEVDIAMEHRAAELGFSSKELRGRYADPRILELIHDSAVLKQITSSKTKALETVRKAPPVVKPGSNTTQPAVAQDKALRQRLRQSGDMKDAARLLLSRMR